MSPRSTLNNCGNSSIRDRRRKPPTRVILESRARAQTAPPASASTRMVRSLRISNTLPSRVTRCWRYSTGPRSSSRMASMASARKGAVSARISRLNSRSKPRLATRSSRPKVKPSEYSTQLSSMRARSIRRVSRSMKLRYCTIGKPAFLHSSRLSSGMPRRSSGAMTIWNTSCSRARLRMSKSGASITRHPGAPVPSGRRSPSTSWWTKITSSWKLLLSARMRSIRSRARLPAPTTSRRRRNAPASTITAKPSRATVPQSTKQSSETANNPPCQAAPGGRGMPKVRHSSAATTQAASPASPAASGVREMDRRSDSMASRRYRPSAYSNSSQHPNAASAATAKPERPASPAPGSSRSVATSQAGAASSTSSANRTPAVLVKIGPRSTPLSPPNRRCRNVVMAGAHP